MAEFPKERLISSLKDMQTEITAIRYYNGKLASLKKQIDTSDIDQSAYDTGRTERIIRERDRALASLKTPSINRSSFDIILFAILAVFSPILMIMLFPGDKMPLAVAIVNWIVLIYGVLYSVYFAARRTTALSRRVIANNIKIGLFAGFALSVVALIIDSILSPIFLISACPVALGFLMLAAKKKENKRLDAQAKTNAQGQLSSKYDKMIRTAQKEDEAEMARLAADLEVERLEKHKKHASVISECTKALAKHKARFNEVNILPADVLKKDTDAPEALLKILQSDKADNLDEAIRIWQRDLLSRDDSFAQVYVSASVRRREGWGPVRNMMYVDGAKVGTAEPPHKVIKVVPGTHTFYAKVQLNYGGESHYPQSEPVQLTLRPGQTAFIKYFVSGNPVVQYRICRDMNEFSAQL